jgi:hypothetical protein
LLILSVLNRSAERYNVLNRSIAVYTMPVDCFRCGDLVEGGRFRDSKTKIFVLLAMPSAGTLVPTGFLQLLAVYV